MLRLVSWFVLLTPAAVVLGCGNGISVPKTTPVRGTVLYKGKPSPGTRVTFHPQFDIGAVPFKPTGGADRAGKFVLSTGAIGDGAPPGEYVVTFDRPQVESDRKNGGIEVEVDAWKGKYSDPATSKWKVKIEWNQPELEPFRIE